MEMTEQWDLEDNHEENTPQTPKGLRDAYKAQLAENERLAKELSGLQSRWRDTEVRAKLSAKGLPERAVGLFPRDADPTDDVVTKWIEDYGDLFAGASTTQETTNDASVEAPKVDPEPFKQMQAVAQGGSPGSSAEDFARMLANPNLSDEVPFEQFKAALLAQQEASRKK